MAKSHSTRRPAPSKRSTSDRKAASPPADRPATRAQQRRALDYMIRNGGFAAPRNPLVARNPGDTVMACREFLERLASNPRDHLVFGVVCDALRHVEQQIGPYWADEGDAYWRLERAGGSA